MSDDLLIHGVQVLVALIFGAVVALLAKRKNRNPWFWGVMGFISWIIALLVLAFLPYRCPKCEQDLSNQEGRDKSCPHCGSFAAA